MSTTQAPVIHSFPWTYDAFKPVIFAGFNIEYEEVFSAVEIFDIALTLSAIMKIKARSVSEGKILSKMLDN